ncbi:hypothetical protein CKO28_17295 [Rhodovibrio sodomensis]|uniref:Threonine transporter n=1 Tax=Rhodovibrio sodomensis TaxID=1088 RepID=A0ABS1DH46_9PROT|nr:LysE family translocator [Rhodovibrio sodomensis]MBK1669795.1 hypothetical protein [Rhodovibrio sodomensis]
MDVAGVLAAVAIAHFLVAVSPGPAFLVVVRSSVARTRLAGLCTAVGLAAGSTLWAVAALFGLQALFAAVPWIYSVLKLAGATYLVWIGISLWRNAGVPIRETDYPAGGAGLLAALRLGLVTQLANPKAAIFFGSIFVTMLPADPALATTVLLLLNVFLLECGWYGGLAASFSTGPVQRSYKRAKVWIDRAAGATLGAFGVKLAADR